MTVKYYPEIAEQIRQNILDIAEHSTEKLDLSIVRDKQPRVNHLGISSVGKKCDRCTWLSYHGYSRDSVEGRVQLLFEFGDYIEESIIHYLKLAGYKISKRQYESFICNGLVPGHNDGVLTGNLPAPINNNEVVFDVKSANKAAFTAVKKHGTAKHYPSYYGQINSYGKAMVIPYSCMIYQSKDNSDLCVELFDTDTEHVKRIEQRVFDVISLTSPPPCNGDFIERKFCGFKSIQRRFNQDNFTCGGCHYFSVNKKGCGCKNPKHPFELPAYGDGKNKFWCKDFHSLNDRKPVDILHPSKIKPYNKGEEL